MSSLNIPQTAERFEITTYKSPQDIHNLKQDHVAFSGSPRRHPYDAQKVILVGDPFSTHPFYDEFLKSDITVAEELPNWVNHSGETVPMVRIWVRKGAIGVRCTPFRVSDLDAAE